MDRGDVGAGGVRRGTLRPWQALLAAGIGGVAAQAVGLVVVVVAGFVAVVVTGARTAEALTPVLRGPVVFSASVLAVGGVLLLTALFAPLVARVQLRAALGLRRASVTVCVLSAVGTLGVGVAGDLSAMVAHDVAPNLTLGSMQGLMSMTRDQPVWVIMPLLALVPGISEELFFRGMLLRAFKPSVWSLLGVALAFSVYHLDPHHVVATLPAGLYFTWLAVRTQSTIVPIVAHVANNVVATTLVRVPGMQFGYGTDQPIPPWWLALTLVVSSGAVLAIVLLTRQAGQSSRSAGETEPLPVQPKPAERSTISRLGPAATLPEQDPPRSSRRLLRCQAHGLAYDPSIHTGCVICRRDQAAVATGVPTRRSGASALAPLLWVGVALLGAAVLVATGLAGWFLVKQIPVARSRLRVDRQAALPTPAASSEPLEPRVCAAESALPPPKLPEGRPMLGRTGTDQYGYPRDTVDRVGMLTLLRHRKFHRLTEYIEGWQNEFETDFRKEYWIDDAILAFDTADPRLLPLLDDWVRATPESFAPYVARGTHRLALGYHYRGGKYLSKTSPARLDRMRETMTLAEPDLRRSIQLRPKLVEARHRLLGIAMALGRRHEKAALVNEAEAICPLCFSIRAQYLHAIKPRWGGSYAAMEAYARRVQPYAHDNPRLRVLLGRVDHDRCNLLHKDGKLLLALAACDRAVSAGDYASYHYDRAVVLRKLGRNPEALAACNRALEIRPQLSDILEERAYLLLEANRFEAAAADVELTVRLDPIDRRGTRRFDRLLVKMVKIGHAHFRAKAYDAAIQAYNRLLAIHPGHVDALTWRGVARARKGDTAGGMEDLNLAVQLQPDSFDACLQFDHQLAARRQFDVVVRHWNRFLALRPDHARAHYERGGAYYNQGKYAEALRDAKDACRLGYDPGCKLVRHMETHPR